MFFPSFGVWNYINYLISCHLLFGVAQSYVILLLM